MDDDMTDDIHFLCLERYWKIGESSVQHACIHMLSPEDRDILLPALSTSSPPSFDWEAKRHLQRLSCALIFQVPIQRCT